ncbi:hypothetical protein J2S11_003794 [Bacillus horti]|uniref:Uncharacterized protein n=1 Tax=Caldalkalibacillus horti TaxID=77523 RepID=A0ABT9W4U3_9BACI|nr:hypothetical protein [Bacillus horti]
MEQAVVLEVAPGAVAFNKGQRKLGEGERIPFLAFLLMIFHWTFFLQN